VYLWGLTLRAECLVESLLQIDSDSIEAHSRDKIHLGFNFAPWPPDSIPI
jgi:hypothetical protein